MLFMPIQANSQVLTIVTPALNDAHTINARIFSKYLRKYLPDHPTIIFEQVFGAEGLIEANYLYNNASKDGNTIGVLFKNIPIIGAIGGPNVKFDPSKFTWLGSTADGHKDAVLLLSNKPYDGNLILGSDNVVTADPIKFIQRVTGWNIKEVLGYHDQSEIRLAVQRGEIDGMVNSMIGIQSSIPQWFDDNSKIKPLLQFGNGNLKHPKFPDVPTLYELTSEKDRPSLKIFEDQFRLLRPYIAPPGIPEKRSMELREAFNKASNDPEYIEEAAKVNINVSPIEYQEAQKIIDNTMKTDKSILDTIK